MAGEWPPEEWPAEEWPAEETCYACSLGFRILHSLLENIIFTEGEAPELEHPRPDDNFAAFG